MTTTTAPAATLVFGYAARGRRAHAVDLTSSRNLLAQRCDWTDTRTGLPYRESLCGAVVNAGEVEWVHLVGLTCTRCARLA